LITPADIASILHSYDLDNLAIGTLGSHSSLNIFKGAKEEGFRTVCICKEKDAIMYRKYSLVDEMIIVNDFTELLNEKLQERLRQLNVVLIPHGSQLTCQLKS
jgi:5-formaminoimidazole-4-carboxamide-1-(beta)-D-ribofuranosyl 5'-monophosphate synthetase